MEIDRGRRRDISRVTGHRGLVAVFLSEGSGRVLVVLGAAIVAARALASTVGPADIVAVAVVIGVFPFVEWVIHTHVLHRAPGRLGPLPFDPARSHRFHHEDPGDTRYMMLRWFQALAYGSVIAVASMALVGGTVGVAAGRPLAVGLSAAAVGVVGLGLYEWLHLLFHSGVTPKMRWVRTLRARHRLHHWRNERYWMGVTSNVGDRVLRTLPADPADVPRSSTARAPDGEVSRVA